jgi:NAD(P)-dependent dehydrogenase (short-subunit alcohol dehydrogenase family)
VPGITDTVVTSGLINAYESKSLTVSGLLQNKVALVTGGGSGIGRGISILFSQNGANIGVADISEQSAQAVSDEINKKGGRSISIAMDVSKRSEVRSAINALLEAFSKIDILVNCAGIVHREQIETHPEEAWRRVIDVNLTGTFICAQEAAKQMIKENCGGKIINIASTMAIDGGQYKFRSSYAASKGGVVSFTKNLAVELGPKGINVNAIAPGETITGMTKSMYDDPKKMEVMIKYIPLGRIADPLDIAKGALFLASDLSSYVTGHLLVIDGGLTIGQKPDPFIGI